MAKQSKLIQANDMPAETTHWENHLNPLTYLNKSRYSTGQLLSAWREGMYDIRYGTLFTSHVNLPNFPLTYPKIINLDTCYLFLSNY